MGKRAAAQACHGYPGQASEPWHACPLKSSFSPLALRAKNPPPPGQPFLCKLHLYSYTNHPYNFYMDIAELVREAKQGSAGAQKCLFDLWADKMLLHCMRYVKNRENAEEILLDGFYKFFKALNGFTWQGESALYGWLKKIMVNECLMFLRKKHVFTIVTESMADEIPLDEQAIDRLSAAEIFDMILQLPIGYRTVFNLYAVEGMNHREVAGLLGISEGTSKSQLSKARSLLQKMLLQKGTEYGKRKTQ